MDVHVFFYISFRFLLFGIGLGRISHLIYLEYRGRRAYLAFTNEAKWEKMVMIFKKKKNHMRAERMGRRITRRPNSIGTSRKESWQQENDDSI